MSMKFTSDHVWVEPIGADSAKVGITLHAQETLGDVVFVEFPSVGSSHRKGDVCGVVESVKAAADLFMPVDGTVTEINEALRDDPALANADPLAAGWFFKIAMSDAVQVDSLMDASEYQQFSAAS